MSDKKIAPLTIRLEPELLDELMRQALVEDRSASDVVRRAVRMYVASMRALTPEAPATASDNVLHDGRG